MSDRHSLALGMNAAELAASRWATGCYLVPVTALN